jgi:hypothetical protein
LLFFAVQKLPFVANTDYSPLALGSTYEKDTFTFLLYLLIFRNWSPNYLDLVLLGCRKKKLIFSGQRAS